MRRPNPLSEILEASMVQAEPMLDTEWPAGEVLLQEARQPEPAYVPRLSVAKVSAASH